ncbi:MAG TPA: PIN domain-containing protein [Turneriella sp.]|nr:PIN domain-containing protein [Turneriella sp.]HNA80776.1 PIN domain-containing protein [Turneriella sp.]HNE18838.1 PIN domain-containing protein [Turneriella sp.]HNJ64591.1 PIN domain-containing protein [Turneriella sp.]HNL09310.1 PIN domain-containing protein [Turneriella sp.]
MHSEFIADTSVWVNHFKRRGSSEFVSALRENRVLLHSLVYAELVLGGIEKNEEADELLGLLRRPIEATYDEILEFIRVKKLAGRGVGWVDAALLASAALSGCGLLTEDKALRRLT